MKHKCLHHCCWDGEFSKETFHPSLKSALCLGLGEWSFPWYKAHACSSSVILYDPGAYQQFDLESQLSSFFAFHLIICGSCFAILLWYEEDGSNAVLIVRGKMFSGFSEETTFCMIVTSTKGLWYVKTLKTFQDSNAGREEGLPKMEETTCGVLWRQQTLRAIRDPCRTCWNTDPATPLRVSDLVFLGRGPNICISNTLPGAAAAAVPGHTLRTRAWGCTQWLWTWCPPF